MNGARGAPAMTGAGATPAPPLAGLRLRVVLASAAFASAGFAAAGLCRFAARSRSRASAWAASMAASGSSIRVHGNSITKPPTKAATANASAQANQTPNVATSGTHRRP